MYTLVKGSGAKKLMSAEMPAIALALVLAETLYKFGSFLLECSAFLFTWYIISFLFNKLFARPSFPRGTT
jgi:hypothetical protein